MREIHSKKQAASPAHHSGRPYLDNPLVHAALITLVCLAVYSNTFHVPFQFDDPTNITDKPYVRDVRSFFTSSDARGFAPDYGFTMRWVGYLTFALNYRVHGTDVVGYHIVNLVIHMVNALLLYALVLLTFESPRLKESPLRGSSRSIALFSALLFAVHPVQTQAVTYIVQRLASLAALFYLASVVLYAKARLLSGQGPSRGYRGLLLYGACLAAAVLAMKTKETAFTLPVAIALYEFLFFQGGVKKRALLLAPLLLTMLIIPAGLVGTAASLGDMIGEAQKATKVQTFLTRPEYFWTECRVIVTYLRLLFLPVDQNLDYDYPVFRSFFAPEVFLSCALLVAVIGTGFYFLYRDRRFGGAGRLIAFGIFWFFIALSVESSIIPIADVIFEHRLYLPSAGFFISITAALFLGAERLKARWARAERALAIALASAVLLFGGAAFARNTVWQSEAGLWKDVIQKSPMKARGYNGLGLAYFNSGGYDKAIEAFSVAVSLYPSYGVAFNNLGNALYRAGRYEGAVEAQSKAVALEPDNAVFLDNRGLTFAAMGEYSRAAEDYRRAIGLDPFYGKAHHNLGFVYYCLGQYDAAADEYAKAIALEPDNGIYYSNRALSFVKTAAFDRAIADYTTAIALNPTFADAYNGRGSAYGFLGKYEEAVADFSSAISLDPSKAGYYANRGLAFLRLGRSDRALSDFERACSMGSDSSCKEAIRLKDVNR